MSARKATAQLALPATVEQQEPPAFKNWALVELYGHQRIVGLVTADPIEFPGMVRVDVPDLLKEGKVVREGFTRYVGRGALYGVNPITQETALKMLPHVDGRPSRPMELGSDRW